MLSTTRDGYRRSIVPHHAAFLQKDKVINHGTYHLSSTYTKPAH